MLTADKFKRVGYTKEEAERIDPPNYFLLAGCMETIEEKSSCNGITCRAWTDFNYGYCWTIY